MNDSIDFVVDRWLLASRVRLGILSFILVRVKGFVSLPFYARILGDEGLGAFSLIGTTVSLIWPLFNLNLSSGLAAHVVHMRDRNEIGRAFYTVVNFTLLSTSAGLILMAVFLKDHDFWGPLLLTTVAYTAAVIGRELALIIPQVFQMTRLVALFSIIVEYGGFALSIGLIWFGYGVVGGVTGLAISIGIGSLWLHRWLRRHLPYYAGIDPGLIRQYLAFSLPMMVVGLSQWAIQGSDNYFLLHYHGVKAVGIYSFAYSLASVLLGIPTVLNYVYYPTLVKLREANSEKFLSFLRQAVRITAWVVGLATVLSHLLQNLLVQFLAGPHFAPSAPLIPWIFASYAVFVLIYLYQGAYFVLNKNSKPVMTAYLTAALTNFVLNLLLIPRLSTFGAAWATLAAYLIAFLLIGCFLQIKQRDIGLLRPLFMASLALIATLLLSTAIHQLGALNPVNAIPWSVALTAFHLGISLIFGAVRWRDLRDLIHILPIFRGRTI